MAKVLESAVSKSDCRLLVKKMNNINNEIMRYASDGFKTQGWGDAFMLRVGMHDLKKFLIEVLEKDA